MKRKSTQMIIAVAAVLAMSLASPNAALAAAPQHHDQAPGFFRLKVGDLEVTALYDGTGVFDPHWLNGTKATMDGVAEALREDPHMLDVADTGFLVNTGKQLILVDVGAGTWWGGPAFETTRPISRSFVCSASFETKPSCERSITITRC